ncbi:DoxX family protein [Alicyclobacillus pomorum]|jgi:putative oxidoreductase|uniref:DoxX family protein n=1 Tax=Alicyclobacillus pomorum TaxID=204470 RepID=UPI0004027D82|nr:DoxX family protein [Alicyclobacillus pomorum]
MNTSQSIPKFSPLPIRFAVGITFFLHGLMKFTNTAMMIGFFTKVGIPLPHVSVIIVGLVEVLGGLSLMLGWLTRLFTVLLALDMLTVIIFVQPSKGFLGNNLEILLLAGVISIFLSGAGALSLQRKSESEKFTASRPLV